MYKTSGEPVMKKGIVLLVTWKQTKQHWMATTSACAFASIMSIVTSSRNQAALKRKSRSFTVNSWMANEQSRSFAAFTCGVKNRRAGPSLKALMSPLFQPWRALHWFFKFVASLRGSASTTACAEFCEDGPRSILKGHCMGINLE